MNQTKARVDVVIVGAGAAGFMAAIWAGRSLNKQKIVILEGQKKLGAKILISGGGRCNVTHQSVHATDFCGSSKNAIKKVLTRFPVSTTIQFFEQLGIELKLEETGKLFPKANSARAVLDALLNELTRLNISIKKSHRVLSIEKNDSGFNLSGDWGLLQANNLILATGGKSIPQTGSDGLGYELVKKLGHTLTPRILPALVPLKLSPQHPLKELSGISLPVELALLSQAGKRLTSAQGDLLFTHQGISGPVVLDISRHYLDQAAQGKVVRLVSNWLPQFSAEQLDLQLQQLGKSIVRKHLKQFLPNRLVDYLGKESQVDENLSGAELIKSARKKLVSALSNFDLPIDGSRGFQFAEVTAGGVPLSELDLKTMESRLCPGLYLCGEICDVDGRIGGFNFQWAWASGFIAGSSLRDSSA